MRFSPLYRSLLLSPLGNPRPPPRPPYLNFQVNIARFSKAARGAHATRGQHARNLASVATFSRPRPPLSLP